MLKRSSIVNSSTSIFGWGFLILFISCKCKQFEQGNLIEFKCTLESAQSIVYLKEADQVKLTLTITSDQELARKATYKLKTYKVLNDQKGEIDTVAETSLNYGANKITYHPKSLGKHTLEIFVTAGVEEDEGDKSQIARCTLEVKDHQIIPYEASLQFEQSEILPGKYGSFVLDIQPKEVQAKDLDFKIKNWEVVQVPRDAANVVQGKLCSKQDNSSEITAGYALKSGKERLYYILSGGAAGTYELRITLTNQYGEERNPSIQFKVAAATYEFNTAIVNDENRINFEIDTEKEALKKEIWRLKSHRWSRGLEGDLLAKRSQALYYGTNDLSFNLRAVDLREPPKLTLELQGPDQEVRSVEVDMMQACKKYLRGHLEGEDMRKLEEHLHKMDFTCQYQIDEKDIKAKKKKREELEKLLATSAKLQKRWIERLSILEHNQKQLCSVSCASSRNRDAKNSANFNNKLEEAAIKTKDLLQKLTSKQDIIKGLIKALADLRGKADPSQALFKALKEGNQENINLFLNSPDLDVNVLDSKGRSLLHKAVQYNQLAAAEKLIKEGVEIDLKDPKGYTASMIAAMRGELAMLKLLWNHGAALNVVKENDDKEDFTLMHMAAYYGQIDVIKFLIANGRKRDINAHGKNAGNSSGPMYWASKGNKKVHAEVYKLLMQCGASIWYPVGTPTTLETLHELASMKWGNTGW